MQVKFDKKVEKYFEDQSFRLLQGKLGKEISRSVKKRIEALRASNNLSIFLTVGLGKPHPLVGDLEGYYSVNVSPNYRLIFTVNSDEPNLCDLVIVKGVVDYHDGKNNWIIP